MTPNEDSPLNPHSSSDQDALAQEVEQLIRLVRTGEETYPSSQIHVVGQTDTIAGLNAGVSRNYEPLGYMIITDFE